MPDAVGQADATLKYGNAELSGPVQLIEKGLYFAFAAGSLWILCWTLDKSRPFFDFKCICELNIC